MQLVIVEDPVPLEVFAGHGVHPEADIELIWLLYVLAAHNRQVSVVVAPTWEE